MKRTSGKRWISLVLALCLCLLVGCGGKQTGYDPLKGVETRMITDSAGRQVEIPAEITRIAPSGSTAQMILMPVAYDLLVGLSSSPSTASRTACGLRRRTRRSQPRNSSTAVPSRITSSILPVWLGPEVK